MNTLGVIVIIAFIFGLVVLGLLVWQETRSIHQDEEVESDPIRVWLIDTVFRVGVPLSGHWEATDGRPKFRVQALTKLTKEQKNDLLNAVDVLRSKGVEVTVETLEE